MYWEKGTNYYSSTFANPVKASDGLVRLCCAINSNQSVDMVLTILG